MTLQQRNKAVSRSYLEAISNARDFAAAECHFAPGVTFNGSGDVRAQIMRQLNLRQGFPDLRLTIEDQIAEDDRVVTRVTFHGTHSGEFAGVAATGRPVAFGGTAVDRLVDGKVIEMWHTANVHMLMQQIGAGIPASPAASAAPAAAGEAARP